MKVFVIMSNDFPAGVLDDEKKAEAFVKAKNAAEDDIKFRDRINKGLPGRIYWRSYGFELNGEPK